MAISAETRALMAIAELPQVGERTLNRVRQIARRQQRPLHAVVGLPAALLKDEFGLPAAAVSRLADAGSRHQSYCRATLARLEESGVSVHRPEEEEFPRRWLRHSEPCPPIAYQHGSRDVLTAPTIAVLSSRDVTEASVLATVQIMRAAARDGITSVSGGMKTTYRIAAVSGRATGTSRAIVLDRGMLNVLGSRFGRDPFGFTPGRARFDSSRSVVLSIFRPNDHASPRSGRRRDELIAALADLIVVAHARPGGGIERLCLRCLDRGQAVLSWQAENPTLVAAGAGVIEQLDLASDLTRFIRPPVASTSEAVAVLRRKAPRR